jgi:flagellar hook-associated protein 3 FlgL
VTIAAGTRVSNATLAHLAIRNINRNMEQMLDLQHQLATGLRLYKISRDPAGSAIAMGFQTILERQGQVMSNLQRSTESLGATDAALNDLQDLLNQAVNVGITNVGTVDPAERQNAATVIGALIEQLTQIGNRQYQGRYIFGGRSTNIAPFNLSESQVRFTGDNARLYASAGGQALVPYNITASEAFGSLTGSVTTSFDLQPTVDGETRLRELNSGQGVRKGSVEISDGTNSVIVDLSHCDNLQDVINAINNNGVLSVVADLNDEFNGLKISGLPGSQLRVVDLPGGFAARDLGIQQQTALPPDVELIGSNVQRQLTALVKLSQLNSGDGISSSGFRIRIGGEVASINLAGAQTVQDLLNAINFCGLGVVATIDATARTLTVANTVASDSMSIGEFVGDTATQLGIRTMTFGTELAQLNGGLGVSTIEGLPDLRISTRDGSQIDIDLTGSATLGDILNTINNAPGNGGKILAYFTNDGNGIRLRDFTTGGGSFGISALNNSRAATDLGILKAVANPGNIITGDDVSAIYETGVFARLFALRDALLADNSPAISRAAAGLQDEIERVARMRGIVGGRMQLLETSLKRTQDESLQIRGLLSEVRDLDYADAVARFQTLQATFQASLQAAGNILPISLMDFLRL